MPSSVWIVLLAVIGIAGYMYYMNSQTKKFQGETKNVMRKKVDTLIENSASLDVLYATEGFSTGDLAKNIGKEIGKSVATSLLSLGTLRRRANTEQPAKFVVAYGPADIWALEVEPRISDGDLAVEAAGKVHIPVDSLTGVRVNKRLVEFYTEAGPFKLQVPEKDYFDGEQTAEGDKFLAFANRLAQQKPYTA